MQKWAKRDCSKNTLYLFNLCNLLMLCCILRASWGHPVCALERCFVANMAPVKTRGSASLLTLCLWSSPDFYNSHFTIFFPSLFFFPIPAAIWCFLLSAKFLFLTWSLSNSHSRREWINSCHWKMSLLPAGKAVKYNYSFIYMLCTSAWTLLILFEGKYLGTVFLKKNLWEDH